MASGGDREESPGGGYAFEFVFAAVFERRTRTGHEINNHSGHEDRAGLRGFADATDEVDGDACEFGAASFDFTGVDPSVL